MSNLNQKTVKDIINFSGVGLHSGIIANVSIKPSSPNTGIVFKRIDIKTNNLVYPIFSNVSNTSLNTTISNEQGAKVSTIEHLMAALFCLGIDNALIEVDKEEIPILDGSAKNFIELISAVGVKKSDEPIKIIKVNKKIEFNDGERFIIIEPSKLSLEIDYELRYENPVINNQRNKVSVYEDDLNDVFNSRTFCLYEDIEMIKNNGLAKGGSLDNAIVVKEKEILNKDGLRNSKEFVNHKILDCIGDLYTCGYRMIANVTCSQGGHYLTNRLLKKYLKIKKIFQ